MGLGALSERTAQLPRLDLQIPKRIIGRNTEECILSGTIVGMAAMLDGMVQRIEAELGSPATLILTGGAARFVEPLVLHPHIYDPNLLLKGWRSCVSGIVQIKIVLPNIHQTFSFCMTLKSVSVLQARFSLFFYGIATLLCVASPLFSFS